MKDRGLRKYRIGFFLHNFSINKNFLIYVINTDPWLIWIYKMRMFQNLLEN